MPLVLKASLSGLYRSSSSSLFSFLLRHFCPVTKSVYATIVLIAFRLCFSMAQRRSLLSLFTDTYWLLPLQRGLQCRSQTAIPLSLVCPSRFPVSWHHSGTQWQPCRLLRNSLHFACPKSPCWSPQLDEPVQSSERTCLQSAAFRDWFGGYPWVFWAPSSYSSCSLILTQILAFLDFPTSAQLRNGCRRDLLPFIINKRLEY